MVLVQAPETSHIIISDAHMPDWIDIMVHPRSAIQRIVTKYGVVTAPILAALSTVAALLWLRTIPRAYISYIPGTSAGVLGDPGFVFPFAVLWALGSLAINGGVLTIAGVWLGGSGSYRDVLMVMAWSNLPLILGVSALAAITWALLTFVATAASAALLVTWASVAAYGLLSFYRFIILVFALASVQAYSAARALATIVLWTVISQLVQSALPFLTR
jgi:hypothetical protein